MLPSAEASESAAVNCWVEANSLWSHGLRSLPGSSVHGILQARLLECVAIFSSRRSSPPRDWTWVSCIAGRFFTSWATKEAQYRCMYRSIKKCLCLLYLHGNISDLEKKKKNPKTNLKFFKNYFWSCLEAFEILVTGPKIEPGPLSLNHWTSTEFPLKTDF